MRRLRLKNIQIIAFVALGALSGCGADGEPTAPSMSAAIGVSSSGYVGGGIGVYQGPVSVFFGF